MLSITAAIPIAGLILSSAFEKAANLGIAASVEGKGKYRINTPIVKMAKHQIILTGQSSVSITH